MNRRNGEARRKVSGRACPIAAVVLALACVPTVAAAQTVTINGADQTVSTDPNATPSITFQTNNTATVTSSTLTGNVTTTANNSGTLALDNNLTVTGQIGAAGLAISSLQVSSGKTVTINGNLYGALTHGSSAVIYFGGDISGNVTGTGGVTNSTYVINKDALTFGGSFFVYAGDTLSIGTNKLTMSNGGAGIDFIDDQIHTLYMTLGPSKNGQIVSNAGWGLGGFEPKLTISGVSVKQGDQFVVVKDTTLGATLNTPGSTALITWSQGYGSDAGFGGTDKYGNAIVATDLILKASSVKSASEVAGVSSTAAAAIDGVAAYSGTDSGMQSLQSAIMSMTSGSDLDKAGNQLRPAVDRSNVDGSFLSVNRVLGAITQRTETVRLGDAGSNGTGIATGEAMRGLDVWIQGLAANADQNKRGGVDGYNASTWGIAAGADARVVEPARVGLALSYARSDVNEEGVRIGSGLDIDSYGATLYGQYEGAPWYLDAALGYTRHQYGSVRSVALTGFGGTAKANYDGNQYVARLGGGYPVPFGGAVVTPLAHLSWSRLDTEDYIESGAPGANLTVQGQSIDSLKSGLGAKFAYPITTRFGKLVPEARATWLYEFLDTDAPETTASFSGGGSSFIATGAKPARNGLAFGCGLSMLSTRNITFSANYDAELKSEYSSHTGKIELRASF